jgi:hypothetical protein
VELAAPGLNTLSTLSGWLEPALIGGAILSVSPPIGGNASDDSLQSPPLTALPGSQTGTRTGGRLRSWPARWPRLPPAAPWPCAWAARVFAAGLQACRCRGQAVQSLSAACDLD